MKFTKETFCIFFVSILSHISTTHQLSTEKVTESQPPISEQNVPELSAPESDIQPESSSRQNRMLNYFDYFNSPYVPQAAFIPYDYSNNYYDGYPQYEDENEYQPDVLSRANMAKRRPGAQHRPQYRDSPIFYIRLPPTPYMFVPGSGYVSQPPSFNPMMPIPPISPPVAPVPVSPFISIPLNFVSNARPTSVIHFGNSIQPQYTMPPPASIQQQFGMPTYQQPRPQRPHLRPKPSLVDSEVTQLKGQFLFNGRPNEIFVLANSHPNSMYTSRFNPYY